MFSLINLILSIVILIRLYKFDKFYMITYDMRIKEDYGRNKRKQNQKDN